MTILIRSSKVIMSVVNTTDRPKPPNVITYDNVALKSLFISEKKKRV
jgi:hypothetical protein